MKQRPRIYYSDSQKALMWERWKEGWTLHQIAQLFGRGHTSVQGVLARTGGIRPPERTRSETALTLAEREEISRAVAEGRSIRAIAACLGRAASTVSREIKRNGGQECYRANQADAAAWDRALRPKQCKLAENRVLARVVTELLRLLWSPEQIAGWLKHTYPGVESLHVSHETIYRSLFIQARGALKRELLQHLRRTRGMRRSRQYTQKTESHGQIVGAVPISERRRSSGAWPLGRRLAVRQQQQSDRYPGRTSNAVRDAGEVGRQGHRDGRQCAHQECGQAAGRALDRKSTRLNSSHKTVSRMPSSA